MKLYELLRNTKFKFNGIEYTLERIDGMYSRCFDSEGNLIHLAAYSEIEELK